MTTTRTTQQPVNDTAILDALAQFLNLPSQPQRGPLAAFLAEQVKATGRTVKTTEHHDATPLGSPYNGTDFLRTCCCGRVFFGPTPDDADAVLVEHLDTSN
jgi:hypothetical protein